MKYKRELPYTENFTLRESALEERARQVDRSILDRDIFRSWQTWIGDPEYYLTQLKNAVEDAENAR